MRCLSCNCVLSDHEATRKYDDTDEFIDLCNGCLSKSFMYSSICSDDEWEEDYEDEQEE